MKFYTFCFFLILIICNNSQGFVTSFNLWNLFKDDNSNEKMLIENAQGMLIRYENKDDCFKEASLTIRNECKVLKMEKETEKKTKFAIDLTLCQLDIAKFEIPRECKNIDNDDHSRECVIALGRINQFWTTYTGFYREAVQMCFSTRYGIEIDLLSQFNQNITDSYKSIILHLRTLMNSFRNEEKERLPHITKSLNEMMYDIEALKIKSNSISSDMDNFINAIEKIQNKVEDALSHSTSLDENLKNVVPYVDLIFDELNKHKDEFLKSINDNLVATNNLSSDNIKRLNEINEKMIGVEQITIGSLTSHQKLQDKVRSTKKEIEDLLTFSKNEIKDFSTYTQKEFEKFALASTLFYEFIKQWIEIVPSLLYLIFGYNSFLLGEIISLLKLILNKNELSICIYLYTHFISMIIGALFSRHTLQNMGNISKYKIVVFTILKISALIIFRTDIIGSRLFLSTTNIPKNVSSVEEI